MSQKSWILTQYDHIGCSLKGCGPEPIVHYKPHTIGVAGVIIHKVNDSLVKRYGRKMPRATGPTNSFTLLIGRDPPGDSLNRHWVKGGFS